MKGIRLVCLKGESDTLPPVPQRLKHLVSIKSEILSAKSLGLELKYPFAPFVAWWYSGAVSGKAATMAAVGAEINQSLYQSLYS